MYRNLLTVILIFSSIFFGLFGCTFEKATPETLSDAQLFAFTVDTLNKTYYQDSAILAQAGNSTHGSFKLQFNSTAAGVLDANLELPSGSEFPDGSLLAKEVFEGGVLDLYTIMYKYKGAWLWAEYGATGNVVYSVNLRGKQCTSCHSDTPNRDLVRTFDLH